MGRERRWKNKRQRKNDEGGEGEKREGGEEKKR